MDTVLKGFWLLVVLSVLAMNQGCGQAPASVPDSGSVVTQSNPEPLRVVIIVPNSGTQDSASGAHYTLTEGARVTVPAVIFRTSGVTEQDGLGVGVDLGSGQCYYNASVASSSVFTLSSCTNGLGIGVEITLMRGQVITLWSYAHVNSNDSVVELILQGTEL